MNLYLSGDADNAGQLVGRARLADDDVAMRKLSHDLEAGNEIWKKWAESHGGSQLEAGGDEFCVEVPADYLDEIVQVKEQYEGLVGATLSLGVGMKISESSKALLVAKLQGKNRVVFFTDEVAQQVEAAMEQAPKTEQEKIVSEYLTKGAPAMNPGEGAGFAGATKPSPPTTDRPVPTQGDHEQGQVMADLTEGSSAPQPAEQTHAGDDMERQLHEEAWKGHEQDMQEEARRGKNVDKVKAQVVQALQLLKQQAPALEQLKQAAPQVYQATLGLAQAVIGLARELSPQAPAGIEKSMNKSETRYCTACKDPLDKDGHCKVKAHWEELDADKAEPDPSEPVAEGNDLEKAKLPMPHVSTRHEVVLPSGAAASRPRAKSVDSPLSANSVKITHSDGTTGWRQVEAGQIRSQDPTGHPTSSREPNAK